jgi:DNA-binding CsgD family transcriptional regulator
MSPRPNLYSLEASAMPQTVFLQERFDLTAAEARLALHLVGGNSLKSAAKALNIGYETARTTLKSVFHKTGTCDRWNWSFWLFTP